MKIDLIKQGQCHVPSQCSIKIIKVKFGNLVLDDSNYDKINHSLTKKNQYLEQSGSHFEMKNNCKPNPFVVYGSYIYSSKIYPPQKRKKNK